MSVLERDHSGEHLVVVLAGNIDRDATFTDNTSDNEGD